MKEELLDILRKNKSKLGLSLNDAKYVEWLTRTDTLIDQVVYRLYGLTRKEIAVVEERQ